MAQPVRIAWFITPHGFGHATRAAAVMAALHGLHPDVRFELFSTCPDWIFRDSMQAPFRYHRVQPDVGLVQATPLQADLAATLAALDRLFPLEPALLEKTAALMENSGCSLAVCDIAPLGIAAARLAGIPSVLVENFTWDWVYASLPGSEPRLQPHIDYLRNLYAQADLHIQTEPLCQPAGPAARVGPIARLPRTERRVVRDRLHVDDSIPVVMISMGGVQDRFEFLGKISEKLDVHMLVPGADFRASPHPNIILLPAHSDFFHPDLITAADVLIAKAGYSTVAEAYFAGIPYGCVVRRRYAESRVLEAFIKAHLPSCSISPEDYRNGRWIGQLPDLLAMPRSKPAMANGAADAARMILELV
jgi:hypothetical protein